MPIVAGFASSHAPAMFEPIERWPLVYSRIPEYMKESQPHTAKDETPEVMGELKARIEANFRTMSDAVMDANLDLLIFLGDDQGDMFDSANIPAFALFTGDELWGLTGTTYSPPEERLRVTYKCDGAFGGWLLKELMKVGFDFANCSDFVPRGPRGGGVSHMVAHIMNGVLPNLEVPIVPLFIDEYDPPMPTGRRCIDLGYALAKILDKSPKRIGLYASGGLSHDPAGPRAGWIDQPLDTWFLERLRNNDTESLSSLFSFDSATLRGGTGEIRAWITVAAALGRSAEVLDYLPVHHSKTGLGWAIWRTETA